MSNQSGEFVPATEREHMHRWNVASGLGHLLPSREALCIEEGCGLRFGDWRGCPEPGCPLLFDHHHIDTLDGPEVVRHG